MWFLDCTYMYTLYIVPYQPYSRPQGTRLIPCVQSHSTHSCFLIPSHPHTLTPSHPHSLIPHTLTLTPSHPHLTPSHPHSLIPTPSPSLPHSLTSSPSLPHSLTSSPSLPHSLIPSPSLPHSLTPSPSLPHSLTSSPSFPHTLTLTPSFPHTLTLTPSHPHIVGDPQEAKCVELGQELAKGKEELSSLNIKVKWAQNKLKTETEAHKVRTTSWKPGRNCHFQKCVMPSDVYMMVSLHKECYSQWLLVCMSSTL